MGTANIGMMDSAYFVGRNEILSWINSTLQLSLAKVEEAASGAVQCQMMDMIHPGVVPMHKVNFEAKTEYDMIQNYKLLQEVFSKLKIEKHLEVNKLVKGRPLDNLELLQWLKRYCDVMTGGMVVSDYNPIERRSKGAKEGHRKSTASMQSLSHNRASVKSGSKYGRGISAPPGYVSIEQVQGLNDQISQLKLSVTNLEKDRDFYFSKLRDIEILLQNDELEQLPVVMAIQKVLYAVDDQESAIADAQALLNKSPPSENESMVFPAEASDDERRESDDNKETSASEVDNTEQIQPSDQPTQQESNFFACGDSNGDCMQQVSSVSVP